MKVYEIDALGKPKDRRFRFYSLLTADDEVWDRLLPHGEGFNGTPFGRKWKVQTFYIVKPMIPRPNFFNTPSLAFVCDEKARELAGEPLEMSGEFLPIRVEGEKGKYWIYNITHCINVVDSKRSEWEKLGPGPSDRLLEKPWFIPSRFGEESIFKIPEDRGARSYCLECSGDWEDGEFKAVVEHYKLTGLRFRLVWSDEK